MSPLRSIQAKLAAAFGLAFLLVVSVGASGLLNLHRLNVWTTEITGTWLPQVQQLGKIKAEMVEHWLLASRRVDAADEAERAGFATRLGWVGDELRRDFVLYRAGLETDDGRLLFAQMTTVWAAYEGSLLLSREDRSASVPSAEAQATAAALFDRATRRVDDLIAYSAKRSDLAAESAGTAYRAAFAMTVAAIVVSLLGSITAISWVARNVSGPIGRISHAMRQLTAGATAASLAGERPRSDEIGTLIAAVDGYRESLARGRVLAEAADQERQRLQTAVDNMQIGLVMFDRDSRLIIANSRYAELYRLPAELAKPGTSLEAILEHRIRAGGFPGSDPKKYVDYLARMVDRGEPARDIIQFHDGRIISLVYQPMSGGGWVSTHEDITDRRKAEAKIAHMTHFDALTDLANRVLLRARIEDALVRAGRDGRLAVLVLDLDHFKDVNDTLGHPVGDELLVAVARRLSACVRDGDTVARLGGDEFAIVQVGAEQPKGAHTLAQRLIEQVGATYEIAGHEVRVGVSVGIALTPADGRDADHLLKSCDIALYRAKADGRGVYRFFEPEMDALMRQRRKLELDLRHAIEAREFILEFQPQFNLATNTISGFEALIRWRHPERGMMLPVEFIAFAEETGFIVPIGEWVLKEACAEAMRWPSSITVAVNLSAVQFRSAQLLPAVIGALAAAGLPARRLELEITESTLLGENEATLAILHQLRSLGVRISMDDFGTGYSSLRYLQSFPFDRIKIDRRFVTDVNRDPSSLAIIRAVIGLSASLGIPTTAEGVETREQFERVKAEGCTEVQGFLTGRPMSAEAAMALLERPGSKAAAA